MPSASCPSCGSHQCGPDEDGRPYCLACGGPDYCPHCREPVRHNWEYEEGFSCMVCGETYHAQCLPPTSGGSDIVCAKCLNTPTKEPQ